MKLQLIFFPHTFQISYQELSSILEDSFTLQRNLMYNRRSFCVQKQLEGIFYKSVSGSGKEEIRSTEASGVLSTPCFSGMQRKL